MNLQDNKVLIVNGKETLEVPVKVENNGKKFETTMVRYTESEGKSSIQEIRLGGTTTKLVFNP